VLKAVCEGRLVPTEAELARAEGCDYEPADCLLARILRERRARWEADQLAAMTAQGKQAVDKAWKSKSREPDELTAEMSAELPEGWTWTDVESIRDWSSVTGGFWLGPRNQAWDRAVRRVGSQLGVIERVRS
jgi:type I restriction enzyme, S subunit